jgi:hypothetical protein
MNPPRSSPAMKIKTALLSSILVLGVVSAAFAADNAAKDAPKGKSKQPPEWAGLFGEASLPVVWQSAVAASEKIAAALAEKKLNGIPDWAETIHLASHALQAQVKMADADKQANMTDAFKLSARIADDVTAAAWANDSEKTNVTYQRVKLALAIAQRSLPNEIISASPQAVRFAKKERRDPIEKK